MVQEWVIIYLCVFECNGSKINFHVVYFTSRKIEGSKFTLANGGSNLIVRNLDSSDAGTFECVAKSSAGEARALGYFTIRDPYGYSFIYVLPNLFFSLELNKLSKFYFCYNCF